MQLVDFNKLFTTKSALQTAVWGSFSCSAASEKKAANSPASS